MFQPAFVPHCTLFSILFILLDVSYYHSLLKFYYILIFLASTLSILSSLVCVYSVLASYILFQVFFLILINRLRLKTKLLWHRADGILLVDNNTVSTLFPVDKLVQPESDISTLLSVP